MIPTRKLFYLGLEPLASRYTAQLSNEWFPSSVKLASPHTKFVPIPGKEVDTEIGTGTVLDATGRGVFACSQIADLLLRIRTGELSNDDAIFLQDFWTPGFEAVLYALHLHDLKPRIYSTVWAQSVDEYDFTWGMRSWMRPIELGLANAHTAIFVASTIHRDQLRAAGFTCPIHVVGLTIDVKAVKDMMPELKPLSERRKNVVYSSRIDYEKNPIFMCETANRFLAEHKDWTWTVTTSGKTLRSNVHAHETTLRGLAATNSRFIIREGLTKREYYNELATSRIQFNCALQDYVSWTLLEALAAGCAVAYPDFRSFPECVPSLCRYAAFSVNSALQLLGDAATCDSRWNEYDLDATLLRCDMGRRIQARIACNVYSNRETNVWHLPI